MRRPRAHVQDRISYVESLVLSPMQQQQHRQQQQQPETPQDGLQKSSPSIKMSDEAGGGSVDCHVGVEVEAASPSGTRSANEAQVKLPAAAHDQSQVLPSPFDYGTIRMSESGMAYFSNMYWAAILDRIAQLKNHVAFGDRSPSLS